MLAVGYPQLEHAHVDAYRTSELLAEAGFDVEPAAMLSKRKIRATETPAVVIPEMTTRATVTGATVIP